MKHIKKFNESNQMALDINKEMVNGIKQFGVYSFEDKGPEEVMNFGKFNMKDKSIEDIADILNQFYEIAENKGHAKSVIDTIITDLDDRDDFDGLWDFDKHNIFEY